MALAADATPLRKLWDVHLNPVGGLGLVALIANVNHSMLVVAVHLLLSSLAARSHRLARVCIISIPLKNSLMALAILGMSFTRIGLVFFLPSRRCCFPFSLLMRRVTCVIFTTRSSLLAHAPHSPLQNKTQEAIDATHARMSVLLLAVGQSHWTTFSSASAFSRMASATGASRGSHSGVGARSRWQFARPLRTPSISGPRAAGGLSWSSRNLLMAERYGCRLSAATVPWSAIHARYRAISAYVMSRGLMEISSQNLRTPVKFEP